MSRWIVVTGATGFIGSNLVLALNAQGLNNLILVDDFNGNRQNRHLEAAQFHQKVDRNELMEWLTENGHEVSFVFHLGARTDTTEFNFRVLDALNLSYSKQLWEVCTTKQIPLLYASSAATYGDGSLGFSDAHEQIPFLKPLNPYGLSKHLFDLYALEQSNCPPAWYGLKFFNVYGPHEEHKGRMASVAYHAFHQIKKDGKMKLFKSYLPDYNDGEQLRDFVYVHDIINMCLFFFRQYEAGSAGPNGIYNAGTGKPRTFLDLAIALFHAMDLPVHIEFTEMPEDIRDKYQYYTKAEMNKLSASGYELPFMTLEDGIKSYVTYLRTITS